MGLRLMLRDLWFTRLVLFIWMICAVCVFVLFKNMELIVHGQLYYYGLHFSPDWADPYRLYTWLLYLCLGLPMAASGIALVSSFLKIEKVQEKECINPQRLKSPQGVAKAESRQIVREVPKKVENGNGSGISCPHCKKVFSRALVMLDFHGGSNQLVSVCPYCNHVLGISSNSNCISDNVHVAAPGEKIIH